MSRTPTEKSKTVSGPGRESRPRLLRIDPDVFEAMSVIADSEPEERSDIVGWLDCWAGSDV